MNTKEPSPTADFATVMHSLSQIGILDSGEQRNTAIDHFLQKLTIYTKADSCCIFEHINNDNGAVCVQKFQSAPQNYDAVLMDLQMPVMDGIHATTVIRGMNLPEAHTIPIIAMTANAFQEDIQKCINAGMNLHLSKPVHIKKLLEALASVKR